MTSASRAWRGGKADWKLHVLSGFSLAVAFVCLASALLIVFNLDAIRNRWEQAGRASVYLRAGSTEAMVADLRQALTQTPGVTSVRFISPSDARAEVVGLDSDGALAALPPEAFPASLEVEVATSLERADVEAMTAHLKQIPAVESVETYDRYTKKLGSLLNAGVLASIVLALVVLAAVGSVVGSTVRLAMQRRSIEVEVLRLVGATEQYVRSPFIIEGSVLGAAGSLIAILILGLLYMILQTNMRDVLVLMMGVPPTFLPWYAVLGLVGLGTGLGAVSSHLSLKRMIRV